MKDLLIIEHSEILVDRLKSGLKNEWNIYATSNYPTDLLSHLKADALLLNLNTPQEGGLSVLQKASPNLPQTIIVTSNYVDDQVSQTVEQLGCKALVRPPFQIDYIKDLLRQLCKDYPDLPGDINRHLRILNLNPKLSGYRCLLAIIPFYKAHPSLLLKEVYYSVANSCGFDDIRNMDRAIRTTVKNAWKKRNLDIWSQYFALNEQLDIDRPSNKEFIKCIAEKL